MISVSSDSAGRFTGQLPPGTYAVTATSSLINDGKSTCSRSLTTRVQAARTVALTSSRTIPRSRTACELVPRLAGLPDRCGAALKCDHWYMSLQLTDIWRYPVKSCRGERLVEARVEPWGLAGDRRWMVVDDAGDPVTAREYPSMLLITPELDGGGDKITLSSLGLPDLAVPVPSGEELVPVNVWGADLLASPAGDEAAAWLTGIIGEPVRLVYLDDPTRRPVRPRLQRPRRPGVVRRRLPAAADH